MCHHHGPDHHEEHGHRHETAVGHLTGASGEEVAECPVMPGNMVIKNETEAAGLSRDNAGQRYWLCCATCGALFDADPTTYAHAG